jgi:hypothetical protein
MDAPTRSRFSLVEGQPSIPGVLNNNNNTNDNHEELNNLVQPNSPFMCITLRSLISCNYCMFLSVMACFIGVYMLLEFSASDRESKVFFWISILTVIGSSLSFTLSLFYVVTRCVRENDGQCIFCKLLTCLAEREIPLPPCPFRFCYPSDVAFENRFTKHSPLEAEDDSSTEEYNVGKENGDSEHNS